MEGAMNLDFSPEDEAFRHEVRAWIAAEYDEDLRLAMSQSKNGYLDKERLKRWQKKLAARGWLAVDWPVEYGGPGFTPTQRYIWGVEMAAAHVPHTIPFGVRMCAPVIMAFGSDEQKAEHLPAMRNFDRWWCQGYSEPGSGSDLAALSMRADRDGDDYILNGSKIWTTLAQHADWIFCLVRTSQEVKRQDGISFVLVDMKTPGITVSSLPTLDGPLEGLQEINQVFFDNVRVPVKNRVGEEGKGWTYAKYLLEFERGNAYAPNLNAHLAKVKKIAAKAPADGGEPMIKDPAFRQKLTEMQIRIDSLNATELRAFSGRESGARMGAISSMLKCQGSEAQQALTELALEAVGIYDAPYVGDGLAELKSNEMKPGPDYAWTAAGSYFNYRKTSIYAGSNEIQHNIMAKAILGL
jgi:alkylation response protein AidB-like acyl-CoA dehydrogenase